MERLGRKMAYLFWTALGAMFLGGCAMGKENTPVRETETVSKLEGAVEGERMEGQGEVTELTVDFSKRDGVPLLKKFALFNSGMVDLGQYERDAHLLDELRTDSLRIDLFMGNDGQPFARLVDGTEKELTYHFEELDALVELLDAHGVRPYWSWSYIPIPLQQDGDWRKGPSSLEQWQAMFREFASHYKETGMRIAYNEIYNEPDCGDIFFLGTMEDYTELYIYGAKGLKEGDPDAVVGGPSTAFINITGADAMHSFLNRVSEEKVPLDFFSYHSYGCDTNQYVERTRQARKILEQYMEFDTTELHLNEYNSLIQPFLPDGPAEHSMGGATMLTSFERLLEETDVTLAHWAQFLDTGYEPLGSVDVEGRIKAPYWSYWMYSQMPEERVAVEGTGDILDSGIHGFASADENMACVLVWNDSEQTQTVNMKMLNVPPFKGECDIFRMNDELDPYWNTTGEISLEPQSAVGLQSLEEGVTEELLPGAFTFYRIRKSGAESVPENNGVGTMIRKRYYFPERGKESYSFYDETNRTAYLGMNGEHSARAIVAEELKDLPDMVQLDCEFGGQYKEIDSNTSFSVRIDYAVGEEYKKSVLYTFMPMNPRRDSSVPWGTEREADEIKLCDTLISGNTWLSLGADAPEGWTGRAIITYDMHSTGADTWAEMRLNEI